MKQNLYIRVTRRIDFYFNQRRTIRHFCSENSVESFQFMVVTNQIFVGLRIVKMPLGDKNEKKEKFFNFGKVAEIWRFFPILKFFQNYFQQIA